MLRRIALAACAALLLGTGFRATAQEFRSTIFGSVVDQQQAGVPGARVTAREADTGVEASTLTGDTGQFTLTYLAPGTYTIAAEAPGFKRAVREKFTVSTNQRYQLELKLEVGVVAESVTVSAEASLLTTTSASVGQVIGANQIENMPLNGRTPLVLAQLAFGVTPSSDPRFYRPFDNAGPSDFSMGGGQERTNELLLDGSPDMTGNRRVTYNPPVDAVTEVKVEALQVDAAYGNTGGGTVNVVMKGGTNDFHGTAYNFHQNSAMAATPFFTNSAGLKKPVTRFNQWGVTAGAPVLIPKLFNGSNRLFWFMAYEGIKSSQPEPITTTVPTQAQRNGDFSALLAVPGTGAAYQLYDPLTGAAEGARIRRQPFAGNVIPAGRVSAIARNVVNYYPLPNQAGRADGQDNFLANSVRSDTFYNFLGRMDFNLSDRHRLFWNIRHNDRIENRGNRFNNIATGNFLGRMNWGSTLDDVYTFTPTFILNTRLSWNRFTESSTRPSDGFDFTTLGLPQSLAASSPRRVFPRFEMQDPYNDLGDSGGNATPFDTFHIFTTATKIAGRHTFKFGTDLRQQRESSANFGNSAGRYEFNTNWTRGPLDNSPSAPLGQDMAALMLGLPSGGNYELNATRTNHAYYTAFFLQDDWRLRSNLSLNIGIRWEKESGTVERFNRTLRGFDFETANQASQQARANYSASPSPLLPASRFSPVGGVIYADGNNRAVYSTENHAFSPRFGFAWTPAALRGKTVVRGGGGVFFFTYGTTGVEQPGFSQRTQLVATLNNFLTPNVTLANPFPTGIEQPVGSALGINTFLGQNVTFVNRDLAQPYTVRWGLNLQHELGSNMVLETGYIGAHSLHLAELRQGGDGDVDLNFVPNEFLSTSPVRDNAAINRLTAIISNPFRGLLPGTGLNGATTATENVLRRFPQFSGDGGVRVRQQNTGNSYFHMWQTRIEKRFSAGLVLLANYQYSRMIERTRRLNRGDAFLEKRVANEDRPQRFIASGSYELPFGKGKAIASGAGPVLGRLAGGWVVNAIYTFQSGGPLDWEQRNVIYYGGPLNYDGHRVDGTFDVTPFERDPRLQLERNVRTFPSRFGNLRSDTANNMDLSVIKNFSIKERFSLQYRAEAFNAFNRPSFNGPQLDPTNRNFGRITGQANLARACQMALRLRW